MIPPAFVLGGEDGEVELAQAFGVADDFDCGDFSAREGEAKCQEEPSLRSDDEADRAVDECRLCGASATGARDCVPGPVLCAADFSHGLNRLGGSVGCDNDAGIEHGDERGEVAGAEGGEEGVHGFALAGEIGAGSSICSLNAATGAAGELAG
jgi:hypothetical protein